MTHPDSDHASGLHVVVDELTVKKIWMHKPWEHNEGKAIKFSDGRVTDNSIADRLKSALETAYELHQLAVKKGIPIDEPFTGLRHNTGCVEVIGPTFEYYNELLLQFSGMPADIATESASSNMAPLEKVKEKVMEWISERWNIDLISDQGDTTSAQNHSSAIIQMNIDNTRLIFTGDAGRESLDKAADYIGDLNNLDNLVFIQVPHHGSFRNIGPKVLDKLVGKIKQQNHKPHFTAFCSSAKAGAPKHPSKKVLNAFTRRGANVLVTAGKNIRFSKDAPKREGWTAVNPEPFHDNVEV